MKEEFTIILADNGILLSGENFVQAVENTHNADGIGYDHVIVELGKLLRDDIMAVGNKHLANRLKVTIEITDAE